MPPPIEQAANHTRWAVIVPGRGTAELTVKEREVQTRHEQVADWSASEVERLRAAGGLNDDTYAKVQRVLQIRQEHTEAQAQSKAGETEIAAIQTLQAQLRLNLAALGESEREVSIRNRLLDDLETSEERRRTIAAEQRLLEQQAQERETRKQAALDALFEA
jgi:hypothetical protein